MASEIGHKELTQVDVHDARMFGKATADRGHRDDILRVIVTYGLQVAKLPRHGLPNRVGKQPEHKACARRTRQ